MTRKQLTEVLQGINNELDSRDRRELIDHILAMTTTKQKKELLKYCREEHRAETITSLEENEVIS